MERHEQQVAGADEDRGPDERGPGAGARGDAGELAGADEHGDDVTTDDDRHHAGRQAQPVAVLLGVGAREGRERALGAEDADAEESGGELHRPHGRAAQDPEVDQRVRAAELVADERDGQEQADRGHQPRPDLADAVDPDERQAAGDDQQDDGEQGRAGRVDGSSLAVLALGHAQRHDRADAHHQEPRDQQHEPELLGERTADLTAAERADDGAQLQGGDDQPGGPPRLRRRIGQPSRPVVDQRHLERQPGGVDALHRPGDEEDREGRREGEHDRGRGHHRRRQQQHPAVTVQVAQLGQDGHGDRRQHELRGLEPVDVGVVDVEVPGDVGQQRDVVPLQHAAGELDEDEEADEAPADARDAPGSPRRPRHADVPSRCATGGGAEGPERSGPGRPGGPPAGEGRPDGRGQAVRRAEAISHAPAARSAAPHATSGSVATPV
ncbi:hypothetical protein U6N30_31570 [Blastococcus brunescens]|uniref:Uncharacterized protein n=1 Tax=Blastococcus brunescens TaxID=1564165 RepID=A0ABZ1B1P0_9ACTN|nr:hypothetical protein [Blastococcus sp. BMG 8361]WRL64071.1 hypothetical protein U6N30_31570 [Blastococcus sp. BMG 8361]